MIKESTIFETWINLDRVKNPGVDLVADLEANLPLKDESVNTIYASHVFEHIHNWTQLMGECYRVLKPRGVLHLRVPEARCRAAYADPTHINRFVPETWMHFDKNMNIGFDTLGMRDMGFRLKWNEVLHHHRTGIDDGIPGNYYTELLVDLEKDGPDYLWEEIIFTNKDVIR